VRSLPALLLVPALAQAAPVPAALTAHLREAACIHLDFTQTRTLAALSRPLKASGSLVLARDQGVIWTVRQPIAITYVLGPKGLLVVDADGNRERKTAREAPMVAQMGRILQALTRGDWPALESWFTASGSGGPERWQVELVPKAQAESFVRRITLDGSRAIDRVRVVEAGGDRMELVFRNQRLDAPLTGAEAALLAEE